MSEFSAEVTGFTSRRGDYFSGTPAKTIGSIVVRPPVEAGAKFADVVLGRERSQVGIEHVVTNPDLSIFIAQSSRGPGEVQKADIEQIACRILRLANTPSETIEMMDETPFADTIREEMPELPPLG